MPIEGEEWFTFEYIETKENTFEHAKSIHFYILCFLYQFYFLYSHFTNLFYFIINFYIDISLIFPRNYGEVFVAALCSGPDPDESI